MNFGGAFPPRGKKYYIRTFGCQMNVHDSERLAAILESMAYARAPSESEADVVLLNTCSVREKADQKFFTMLGRIGKLKRSRPRLVIGVCGCVAQRDGDKLFQRVPYVDFVLGTRAIERLPGMLESLTERRGARTSCTDMGNFTGGAHEFVRRSAVVAYVTIMEGCNNFCSYCIVPFVRGGEESRPEKGVIKEVVKLAASGYKEVHLLGQNVNSYIDPQHGKPFAGLLDSVARVEGIERVRFITSHPKDFDESIAAVMAEHPNICNAIHIPPQSGSDKILAAMNRRYDRKHYFKCIDILKKYLKNISVSGDIIVGFPGESDEDFKLTLDLVTGVGFSQLFTFVYSPRPGTAAAALYDDVPREKKIERLLRLQNLQAEIQMASHVAMVGSEADVLIEGAAAKGGGLLSGRTEGNIVVNLEAGRELIGKVIRVQITGAGAHSLKGCLAGCLDK